MTPPFRKSDQGKARFFMICEVTYNNMDGTGNAYSFCMFGVVKTGEAFGVVLVVKARWGERGEGWGRDLIYS